ncbi:hypothetical protein [Paenibacillus sp. WLX2291]|uniref:hypothetical protein n=1 Tax=Paenibacillus sp. WLX2291 TaxID=3296934 RepID=UPI003984122C
MNFLRDRRILILIGLGIVAMFILVIALQRVTFTNPESSKEQNYYMGTISKIQKINTSVDGITIVYSITLDNKRSFAVTKNTHLYTNQILLVGATSDPSSAPTRIRTEAKIENLQIGNKVELWDRQVTDHLFEIFELTTLDPREKS